jgi:hypothetical protein
MPFIGSSRFGFGALDHKIIHQKSYRGFASGSRTYSVQSSVVCAELVKRSRSFSGAYSVSLWLGRFRRCAESLRRTGGGKMKDLWLRLSQGIKRTHIKARCPGAVRPVHLLGLKSPIEECPQGCTQNGWYATRLILRCKSIVDSDAGDCSARVRLGSLVRLFAAK